MNYINFIKTVSKIMVPTEKQMANTAEIVSDKLVEYVYKFKLKTLVLGISGGLDSAVVAALAAKAIKKLKDKYHFDCQLIGIAIPLSTNTEHLERACWVGKTYCKENNFHIFNEWEKEENSVLENAGKVLDKTNIIAANAGFENTDRALSIGNLKSRLRMITLYDIARKTNGIVLGTGNWSEDHAVFFYTLGGDGQVDYTMIKGINKGFEMPVIAKVLGIRQDIIDQDPSDGLKVTEANTDEAQLGATYKEVDIIINAYLGNYEDIILEQFNEIRDCETVQKVIKRHEQNKFKEVGEITIEKGENGLPIRY